LLTRTLEILFCCPKNKKGLLASGHSANLGQVTAGDDSLLPVNKIKLKTIPDTIAYDALIFGKRQIEEHESDEG
jgi:hypothetical protein